MLVLLMCMSLVWVSMCSEKIGVLKRREQLETRL
jgi:hypothetical protein